MLCEKCGTENKEGAKVCWFCGNPLPKQKKDKNSLPEGFSELGYLANVAWYCSIAGWVMFPITCCIAVLGEVFGYYGLSYAIIDRYVEICVLLCPVVGSVLGIIGVSTYKTPSFKKISIKATVGSAIAILIIWLLESYLTF